MVLGYALAVTLRRIGDRLFVLLKLVAVIISILTNSMLLMKLLLIDLRVALLLCTLLRLKLRLFLLTLLLESYLLHRILIQVFVQVLLPFERLVRVTDELRVLFDFSNLFKVLLQVLARTRCTNPFLGFFSDLLDNRILDYFTNVSFVVLALEHGVL
jgi:hypothetical protein